MLEEGQTPPVPAKNGKRTTQVNVRLTAERRRFWRGRRAEGFSGVGGFYSGVGAGVGEVGERRGADPYGRPGESVTTQERGNEKWCAAEDSMRLPNCDRTFVPLDKLLDYCRTPSIHGARKSG